MMVWFSASFFCVGGVSRFNNSFPADLPRTVGSDKINGIGERIVVVSLFAQC